ncbi:MAG: hypothetical protein ABII26_08230 [Pseudomonadota bacterium]
MVEELKEDLKRMARETETRVAKSLLRWKYKKEGKRIPNDQEIDVHSKMLTEQAHEIISRRGKNIWNELKKAVHKGKEKEDSGP